MTISSTDPSTPRLLDQVREVIRIRHYSIRTEQAYLQWIRRFILFHGKRHPRDMGAPELTAFLSHLAIQRNVAASTQNQALNAILFLYRDALKITLPWLSDVQRAKKPQHLPVVFTREEIKALFAQLQGTLWLMAGLTYGGGLRLLECLRLRVKDIDFDYKQLVIRDAKGQKDRVTMLPNSLLDPLRTHLARVRQLHETDLREGYGRVHLPYALATKHPNADREWGWQYVFPSSRRSCDPRSGAERRHHAPEDSLQRAVKQAIRKAGIVKPGSVHTLRHYVSRTTTSTQKFDPSPFLGILALSRAGSCSMTRHSFRASKVLQEGKQPVAGSIAGRPSLMGSHFGERLFFHLQCGIEVDLGSLDVLMAEPEGDGGSIDALSKQVNGDGVPQTVDRDAFLSERGTGVGRGAPVLAEQVLDTMNSQSPAARIGKQKMVFASLRLAQPGLEYGAGRFGERRTPLLASLADHSQMSAGPQGKVPALEPGHLREAEAGLRSSEDKGVIAPAGPAAPIGRGEQGINFGTREKADHGACEAFARDRQDALDLRGVLGHLKGGITKEGVDGRQTQVTSSHADLIVLFQVIQKLPDQWSGDLLESQLRGRFVLALLDELEQSTERIAIGGDGVRAHLTLLHQPLQEKPFEQGRKSNGIAHDAFPQRCSRRRIASRMSSGEPLKYHWVSAT